MLYVGFLGIQGTVREDMLGRGLNEGPGRGNRRAASELTDGNILGR